jgi:hypothetical protein
MDRTMRGMPPGTVRVGAEEKEAYNLRSEEAVVAR